MSKALYFVAVLLFFATRTLISGWQKVARGNFQVRSTNLKLTRASTGPFHTQLEHLPTRLRQPAHVRVSDLLQ